MNITYFTGNYLKFYKPPSKIYETTQKSPLISLCLKNGVGSSDSGMCNATQDDNACVGFYTRETSYEVIPVY